MQRAWSLQPGHPQPLQVYIFNKWLQFLSQFFSMNLNHEPSPSCYLFGQIQGETTRSLPVWADSRTNPKITTGMSLCLCLINGYQQVFLAFSIKSILFNYNAVRSLVVLAFLQLAKLSRFGFALRYSYDLVVAFVTAGYCYSIVNLGRFSSGRLISPSEGMAFPTTLLSSAAQLTILYVIESLG